MDRRKLRGLKRRCQNEACALPFYDLNRAAFACPNCGTGFVEPPALAPPLRSGWRSFGKGGSIARYGAASAHPAVDELDETKTEDVAEEASFTVGSSDEPLLETEDEEDAVPIEPGAADAPGN